MKQLKFIHISKNAGTTIENLGMENNIKWGKYDKKVCLHQHIPLSLKPNELKQKFDWFMVVRNPYERLVSEYYCKWAGYKGKKEKLTLAQFNEFTKKKILNRGLKTRYHYMEQFAYFERGATIHIIKFENIAEEFNNLMELYNLDIRLNRHDNARKEKYKKFSVDSFSPEVIQLINKVYHEDFVRFGYQKIEI